MSFVSAQSLKHNNWSYVCVRNNKPCAETRVVTAVNSCSIIIIDNITNERDYSFSRLIDEMSENKVKCYKQ